jgi:hypothetical protein
MVPAKPPLELCDACNASVRGHNAAAAKALSKGDIQAAMDSLERAIVLYEGSPGFLKTADRQFQLLAKLSEICRLLCYKQGPQKVNDALKLIQRVERIQHGTIQ